MNNDWLDITVLEDYLDGKLDAKTMNRVERQALEDPFVADALAGLSASPRRSLESISLLQKQLQDRVAVQKDVRKRSVITWQRLSIGSAAAVLFITAGIVFWMKQVNYQKVTAPGKQVEVALAPKQQVDTISQLKDQPATKLEQPLTVADQLAANTPAKVTRPNAAVTTATAIVMMAKIAPDTATSITGKVTDAATGRPMGGAYISVIDNQTGMLKVVGTADKDGAFRLKKDSTILGKDLTVSYVSYNNKVVPASSNNNLIIALDETKNQSSEQVVIRGYVKRSKETTTGATYVVSGKEVKDVPVGNVEQLQQGKVAGLNIQNQRGAPAKVQNASLAEVSLSNAIPVEGWDKFFMYISDNNKFKSEPRLGKPVALTFGVDKAGNPVGLKIVDGISDKYNNEAKRLITKGPKWTPLKTDSAKVVLKIDF